MIRIIEWLLDLKNIRLGRDAPLRLEWNTHIEAWMLTCFGIIALAWVVAICTPMVLPANAFLTLSIAVCSSALISSIETLSTLVEKLPNGPADFTTKTAGVAA